MRNSPPSPRATVRRRPGRADYDLAAIYRILDEGLVAHVGFATPEGPVVIPATYARDGDLLYVHGGAASRMLGALAAGAECCVAVTLLDGLVLARSGFHHSMNYRSVVVFGRATPVLDREEKVRAFARFVEHVAPGRGAEVRPPTAAELDATLLVSLPLAESSAKVRSGPPVDDEDDYALPVWCGVVPLALRAAEPVPDERNLPGVALPAYLQPYQRP